MAQARITELLGTLARGAALDENTCPGYQTKAETVYVSSVAAASARIPEQRNKLKRCRLKNANTEII